MTCATWIRSTLGRDLFIFPVLSLHTSIFHKYAVSSAHNLCRSQELMEALSGLSVSLTRPCCCNWLRGIHPSPRRRLCITAARLLEPARGRERWTRTPL